MDSQVGICLSGAFTFAWPQLRGKFMSGLEAWRLSRTELRELLNKYERAVEDDACASSVFTIII